MMEGNYYTDKSNVKEKHACIPVSLSIYAKAFAGWCLFDFALLCPLYGQLKRVKEWVLVVMVEDLEGD